MDKLAAFAPRGEASIAGTVSVGDGETFDVGAALEKGKGTIVVLAGSGLEHSLKGYDALKTTSVPKGAKAVNADEAKEAEGEKASSATTDEKSGNGEDGS